MLQTLARRDDVETLTSAYGLLVVDDRHHIPAAAFESAVREIPARRWLGLSATLERRNRLDDLIPLQLGPVRHTMQRAQHAAGMLSDIGSVPAPQPHLVLHGTDYRYDRDADPSRPDGIAAIYRHLVDKDIRVTQVVEDVTEALTRGRHGLVPDPMDRPRPPPRFGPARPRPRPDRPDRRHRRQRPSAATARLNAPPTDPHTTVAPITAPQQPPHPARRHRPEGSGSDDSGPVAPPLLSWAALS